MARLIMQREERTKEYELGDDTILGRKSSCTIRVPSPKCSREHSHIIKGSGGFFVEDLGSSNGTLVNGKKIGRQLLKSGDVISIGGIDYTFQDKIDDPLVGKRLGKYQILDKVGVGGMGVVYRASQVTLGREVALKVMSPRLATKESFIQSFEREAKIAARLQHPNIIGIHDFGHEDQWYYFSMEFVEGENLLDMALRQGGLSVEECLDYGRQLADALDHAHNQGILHKDIKPQNVMINNENRVKLADMGLASIADEENQASSPETGAFMATPQYVAPEIIRRQEPDPRSDIYSLAATLYHMLTSKPPYAGVDVKDLLKKHLSAPIPDPRTLRPEIPEELALFVMKGLAKEPVDRQQTAREFADGLARMLQRGCKPAVTEKKTIKPPASVLIKAATTRTTSAVASAVPAEGPDRRKLYYIVGAAAAALLLLIVILVATRGNPEQEAAKLLQEARALYVDGNDSATREKLEQILSNYPRTTVAEEARKMQATYQGTPAQQELARVRSELEAGKSDSRKVARQLKLFLQQGGCSNEDQRSIQAYIVQLGEDPDVRSEWEKKVDELFAGGKAQEALALARKTSESASKEEDKKRAAQVLQMLQNTLDGRAKEMFEKGRKLCDERNLTKATEVYAEVILQYPGTSWQMQAAGELASMNDSAARFFGQAWNALYFRAGADDLAGVRELAFQNAKTLAATSLPSKGKDLELYAEGLAAFHQALIATAKEKTNDTASHVRVVIDGKERAVSLDAENGKLMAVGQKNRKAITLSDLQVNDVARLMPARKIEPLQALGGAVFFASHKANDIAVEYTHQLDISEGELAVAGRDLRMLVTQQAPLMNFEAILGGRADLQNCRVINKDTLTFYGEGSYINPRLAVRLTDLRVRFAISDRCVIEATGKDGVLFTLSRRGELVEAQAGEVKQSLRYSGDALRMNVSSNAIAFFVGDQAVGTLEVPEIGVGSAIFRLRSSGSAEVSMMEFGIENPLIKPVTESSAPEPEAKPEAAPAEEKKAEEKPAEKPAEAPAEQPGN